MEQIPSIQKEFDARWGACADTLHKFSRLELDWDGFNSKPMSRSTGDATSAVMRWCMNQGAVPDWITITTDETTLLQVRLPSGVRLKFEIEDAQNIGVAHWLKPEGSDLVLGSPVTFHDVTQETLDQLLTV
jgi:hypothetical protein